MHGVTPILSVFARSPDGGRGLARDMAVRWALAEVGQPYATRAVSFEALKQPAHRARQPFGQIPAYEDAGVTLFESAAIVLHLAERHGVLLPEGKDDAGAARVRAIALMFAAVATVEPPIVERSMALMLERDKPWFDARQAMLDDRVRVRLASLADHLGEREWLEHTFTAGDLMMVCVLRRLGRGGLLDEHATLRAYVDRGEARSGFVAAYAAQREAFAAGA